MKKWILKIGLGLLTAMLLVVTILYLLILVGAFGPMPSQHTLERYTQQTASLVMDDKGALIGKYFSQNRTNVVLDSLPDYIKHALVATEDERFYNHNGIDNRSLMRVFIKTILLQDQSGGGGSTITQQLAKNLFGRQTFGFLTIPINKSKEIILAKRLEETFEKDEILEQYLNLVPFGENVYGIEAAAQRFFNKNASQLKLEEAAVLIGMLKANTSYNPRLHPERSLERRNVVLLQLNRNQYISDEVFEEVKQLPLIIDYANKERDNKADYFLSRVKSEAQFIIDDYNKTHLREYNLETDGLTIETTLDSEVQKAALNAMEKHLKRMQKLLTQQYKQGKSKKEVLEMVKAELKRTNRSESANGKTEFTQFTWDGLKLTKGTVTDSLIYHYTLLQAGILGMDTKTGAIKAYVGGIDFKTQPYDQIQARRQLASAFKPILYAAGLENGSMPCDYISNEPVTLSDFDDWSPENYDKTNVGGRYSMIAALSKSLNLPTLHLYFLIGNNKLQRYWEDFKFSSSLPNEPSAALGTAEGNMIELAQAYSAFANGGMLSETFYIERITNKEGELIYEHKSTKQKQVISSENAELMTQMLQQTVKSGTSTSLRTVYGIRKELAAKTGTSQNYADAWFCSYSPNLVLVSRVGCSSPSIHFKSGANGAGSKLALPLVAFTIQELQKSQTLSAKYFPDFDHSNDIQFNCPDYKQPGLLDEVFDLFSKDQSTLQKEQKKARTKNGIRKVVDEIFGK